MLTGVGKGPPPRRARPLRLFAASRSASGFTLFGGLAALTFVTRPKRVPRLHITADVAVSPGFVRKVTPRTPSQLHGARASAMTNTFQLIKLNRLT